MEKYEAEQRRKRILNTIIIDLGNSVTPSNVIKVISQESKKEERERGLEHLRK